MTSKTISSLLHNIANNINSGNSNIDENDENKIIDVLKDINNKPQFLSKYQAYTYLNMSRAKFDNLVKEGKIPHGIKIAGFKELFWNKQELKNLINKKN